MTRIILIRHGHVDWHNPERFRGRAELALTERGHRQARAAALQLAARTKPDAIYTSSLRRCLDTAAALAAPFRLGARPVAGLADIDYGAWQGLTHEEAAARWPEAVALWFRAPHLAVIPGGESLAALWARTTAALNEILRRHPEGVVVIVGHDSVNRVLLLHTLEMPLSRYWHLRQDPCAISELELTDGSFLVGSLNETQHLASLG